MCGVATLEGKVSMETSYDDRSEGEKSLYPDGVEEQVGALAESSHHVACEDELFRTFAHGVAETLPADLAEVPAHIPGETACLLSAGTGFSSSLSAHPSLRRACLSEAGGIIGRR